MFFTVLFHLFSLKIEDEIANRASLELKKGKLIDKNEYDDVKILMKSLSLKPLASLVTLIVSLINNFFRR